MTDKVIDLIEEMENESLMRSSDNFIYNQNENGHWTIEAVEPPPLITEQRDDSRLQESTDFNGWGGVADPYNTNFSKEMLKETAKGTVRTLGGITDAINGFIDISGEMGEVLNQYIPYGYVTITKDGLGWQKEKPTDIPEWQIPTAPRGDTTFEPFVRGMLQFITGFALTRGGTSIPELAKRAMVPGLLWDPVDGGIATLGRAYGPEFTKDMFAIIDTQVAEDAPAYQKLYGRLGNALEEYGLTIFLEPLFQTVKYVATNETLLPKLKETLKRIEVTVDQNTVGTMGGNITIGMKPERVIDDLGFYSQLREEIGNIKQEKFGSIEQFTNMLKGKVKEEEINWSGLNDAFQGKKFTKQEVIDWLDNNHVELEEIRKQGSKIDDMDNPYAEDYEIDIQPIEDEALISEEINFLLDVRYDDAYDDPDGFFEHHVIPLIEAHLRNNMDHYPVENLKEAKDFETKIKEAIGDERNPNDIGKILEEQGIENARIDIEERLYEEAKEDYYNNPYYEWVNDEGYRIFGQEENLRLETPNGNVIEDGITSLSEAQIQMRDRLFEDGIIEFEPDPDELVETRPDNDIPALGDNNPPKDNIVEGGPAIWSTVTEKGGTNYREFLIRNKNYEGDPSYVKLKLTPDELEELKVLMNERDALEQKGEFSYDATKSDRLNSLLTKQGLANDEAKLSEFRESAHWRGENEKNIIFHVRMSDRKGANGEKVLYVDELQSDWAQQGSGRTGYGSFKTETGSAEKKLIKKKLNELIAEREELFKRENKILNTRNFSSGAIVDDPASNRRYYKDGKWQQDNNIEFSRYTDAQKEELNKINDEFNDIQFKAKELKEQLNVIGEENIPRGPYVQDTDKWTALAIKRLLRVAVEEGYDSIAFSPGFAQFDRWGKPGLAEFYDRKIPSVVKNVMKTLKIKDYKLEQINLDAFDSVNFRSSHSGVRSGDFTDGNSKYKYKTKDKDGNEIEKEIFVPENERLSITITPEIRDKVMKGIALFSTAAVASKATTEMLEEKEPVNGY